MDILRVLGMLCYLTLPEDAFTHFSDALFSVRGMGDKSQIPPEDRSITTLFVGEVDPETTESDIRHVNRHLADLSCVCVWVGGSVF